MAELGRLDADLAAGRVNVTLFPVDQTARNTTRFAPEWSVLGSKTTALLTSSVSDNSVTFGGIAQLGQLAGLLIEGQSYVYRVQTGDTPAHVAANLAELVRADRIAHLTGATVTIPGASTLLARTVARTFLRQFL